MKIIAIAVIKGGTGKTTTAAALAQAARSANKRVLAIDLDPQANLSQTLGADQTQQGSYQLLHGGDPLQLIQHTAQGIDVITAAPDLATERTTTGSATRLQEAITPLKRRYDYIVIDTPPTMGELTFNALQAATALIIPLEVDSSSLQGLYQITDIARQMQRHNPKLKTIGTIINRYDHRPKVNRYLRDVISDRAAEAGAPLIATIRAGVAVREAHNLHQSLYEYAPKSKPAQDFMELYKAI